VVSSPCLLAGSPRSTSPRERCGNADLHQVSADAEVIPFIPESQWEQFDTVTYQMGGLMLFPGRQMDGKPSINQESGFNSQIADRLDLTAECIRLHYLGETSPMAEALIRYGDFFALFQDFNGYSAVPMPPSWWKHCARRSMTRPSVGFASGKDGGIWTWSPTTETAP
jgi:hypothetical protein